MVFYPVFLPLVCWMFTHIHTHTHQIYLAHGSEGKSFISILSLPSLDPVHIFSSDLFIFFFALQCCDTVLCLNYLKWALQPDFFHNDSKDRKTCRSSFHLVYTDLEPRTLVTGQWHICGYFTMCHYVIDLDNDSRFCEL